MRTDADAQQGHCTVSSVAIAQTKGQTVSRRRRNPSAKVLKTKKAHTDCLTSLPNASQRPRVCEPTAHHSFDTRRPTPRSGTLPQVVFEDQNKTKKHSKELY
ncbi:unnamed protein product [Ixodes pacificus]